MDYTIQSICLTGAAKMRLNSNHCFGILLISHGSLFVRANARLWRCGTEELLICKPGETIVLEYVGGVHPVSGFWIRLSPSLLKQLSSDQTDLESGFGTAPLPAAVLRVKSESLMLLKSLASRMKTFPQDPEPYGIDILENGVLRMFSVLILRACIAEDRYHPQKREPLMLDHVFAYIHAHLTEDITLETLEKVFYVSRNHLCREFKRRTGQTIHRYIVKARLDLCREYIEQGYSITEVYRRGGFGGYNHFFRAFKQEYQMTPKQYYQRFQQEYLTDTLSIQGDMRPPHTENEDTI